MNIIQKIKSYLRKKPDVPPCGRYGNTMWCYCGKCKPEEYEIPEDLRQVISVKAIEEYFRAKGHK